MKEWPQYHSRCGNKDVRFGFVDSELLVKEKNKFDHIGRNFSIMSVEKSLICYEGNMIVSDWADDYLTFQKSRSRAKG